MSRCAGAERDNYCYYYYFFFCREMLISFFL